MDLRVFIVLFPIVASVAWTVFWLTKWGVFSWDISSGLKKAIDG